MKGYIMSYSNILEYTVLHYDILWHNVINCDMKLYNVINCNMQRYTITICNILWYIFDIMILLHFVKYHQIPSYFETISVCFRGFIFLAYLLLMNYLLCLLHFFFHERSSLKPYLEELDGNTVYIYFSKKLKW